MGIRPENHASALGKHFTRKLMDDRLMRRNIDPAIFLRGGQSEHVVIFIDRSADRAQRIVAVGQHIRNREPGQARRARRLDNPHIRNVMAGHFVKMNLQLFLIPGSVVRLKDGPRDRAFARTFRRACDSFLFKERLCLLTVFHQSASVNQVYAAIV